MAAVEDMAPTAAPTAAPTGWGIIGHERAARALARAARDEAPAHAYLITGPERVGKRALARALAAALNCQAPPAERPCRVCASCRMTAREAHPDFIVTEGTEEQRLGVKEVRAVRGSVDWRPYQGRFKVYLFPDADSWGNVDASSNVLLKTIEEPPPQAVIVLTASNTETVPITVVSRCRVLPLQPVAPAVLAAGLRALSGAAAGTAERLAALANGRPGWAVAALAEPELVARREEEVGHAVALSEGALGARLLLAGEVCKGGSFLDKRTHALRALEDMLGWWRDLLIVSSGAGGAPVHVDRQGELERQASRRGQARIVRGLREIETTIGAVERNVTPQLALEALLLRLG